MELITTPDLAARYEALMRVSTAIRRHREPKELIGVLIDELHIVVPVDFASVCLRNQDSDAFCRYAIDVASRSEMRFAETLPSEATLSSLVYEQQEPFLRSTDELDLRFGRLRALLKELGVRFICSLPLTTAHRKLGVITFGSKQAEGYSPNEVRFMSQVADQIALAFDDASNFTALRRASEELQSKNERLQLLLDVLENEAQQQEEAVASAKDSLQLFTNRYKGGVDTYLQVITAQTTELANERNSIDILRRRMDASVLLVKALGGSWDASKLPTFGAHPVKDY